MLFSAVSDPFSLFTTSPEFMRKFNLELENSKLRYRQTNDEPVGNVVLRMIRAYGIQDQYYEARAKQLWQEMMGDHIAQYTQSVYVRKRKLYLTLSSAALRQEMNFSKDKIKKYINEGIGQDFIRDVVVW